MNKQKLFESIQSRVRELVALSEMEGPLIERRVFALKREIEIIEEELNRTPDEPEISEDEINELSKKTLGSYIKKASSIHSSGAVGQAFKSGINYQHDPEHSDKNWNKAAKRVKGIERATDRIIK